MKMIQLLEGGEQMPDTENYEILVIGSGEAGKYLAWTMAGAGHRTAVIERQLVGGSCPNIACLPSKNIIHSAKVRSFASRAAEFGVDTGKARGARSSPMSPSTTSVWCTPT
jgi:pyruvate/2-oxoglutarate dehydrogenase complex dihydrolipoamide dehydrogenase (E3) component